MGCVLISEAAPAIPFTVPVEYQPDTQVESEQDQNEGYRPRYHPQGLGLGSRLLPQIQPLLGTPVRVVRGRIGFGIVGTLQALTNFRAFILDEYGVVHNVSIHNVQRLGSDRIRNYEETTAPEFLENNFISGNIIIIFIFYLQEQYNIDNLILLDRITSMSSNDMRNNDDSTPTDTEVVPIGNLLGIGIPRTAPIPIGGGAENVPDEEIQIGLNLPRTEGTYFLVDTCLPIN